MADRAAGEPVADGRRPRALYAQGDEPDPRFSMANERTALAWVRTALAMVAAGVALSSLARVAHLPRLLDAVAALLCAAGAAASLAGVAGWYRRERALRIKAPLPAPLGLPLLTVAVLLVGLVLAGYVGYHLAAAR